MGSPVGVPDDSTKSARTPPARQAKKGRRGAGDVCARAGAVVAGGHTVTDRELKFGLSVSGTCRPGELLRNSGARPGDVLVMTKPIGTGLILNGMLAGKTPQGLLEQALEAMATLNDVAALEAVAIGAHGATDITGFGLGGHAVEMARGAGVRLRIRFDDVPRYAGVFDLMRRGITTAITADNLASMRSILDPDSCATDSQLQLLADPQTSGGLLVAVLPERADAYVSSLRAGGVEHAAAVGTVEASDAPMLRVD